MMPLTTRIVKMESSISTMAKKMVVVFQGFFIFTQRLPVIQGHC